MSVAERIILGSGYLHLELFAKGQIIPNPEEFCKDTNLFAYISGGAELEYKPEYYEAKDDMGRVSKSRMTKEEATLKAGIMTFTGDTLEKLSDTARVSTRTNAVTGDKYKEVRVGGAGNQTGARYVICLHHVDEVDGDIYVMIVGQNQAGFTLGFKQDEATVVDAEFKCMPNLDGEGTLVLYAELTEKASPTPPTPTTTYTVTQNLTNVTSDFSDDSVEAGEALEVTLEADTGYTIGTPTVTMGGETVADAWNASTGKVTIASVSGAVVITASATED